MWVIGRFVLFNLVLIDFVIGLRGCLLDKDLCLDNVIRFLFCLCGIVDKILILFYFSYM